MVESDVDILGLRLHYWMTGHGMDVLLVHGWASSGRMWSHVVPMLANRYRCWLLDLPGFGDSDKPGEGWYSIPHYTEVLREFMHTLGIHQAHVVGHSMGGMITFDLAVTHPDVVKSVIAINPVVSGKATIRPLAHLRHGRAVMDFALRISPRVILPLLKQGDGLHQSVKYLRRRNEDFSKGTTASVIASGQAILRYDLASRLPGINAPTLVIIGTQDLTLSNDEGRLAARSIPNARLIALPTGHQTTDDAPALTAELICDFLG
jgi:3-oxoadipate enol-lactonase